MKSSLQLQHHQLCVRVMTLMEGHADDENDEDEDGDDFIFLKLASLMTEY